MKKHLAVLVWAAHPEQPHFCATPFFHAAAAAAMDIEVEIYFTNHAVRLLQRGVASALPSGPRERETVYTFMLQAAAHGAKFFACNHALEEHSLEMKDLIPEVSGIGGAASFIGRCMDDAWVTLTF